MLNASVVLHGVQVAIMIPTVAELITIAVVQYIVAVIYVNGFFNLYCI